MGLPRLHPPPALCRYVDDFETSSTEPCLTKTQGPDSADQQQRLQDPSPSVEAPSAPHATGTLADPLPQAILGTGMLLL